MAENERTDEAMNAVLGAEQASREAVARCEEEARARLAATREAVRRIQARTDQRIGRIHSRCADLNAERVEALRSDTGDGAAHLAAEQEQELLRAAVRTLAARLSGGENP